MEINEKELKELKTAVESATAAMTEQVKRTQDAVNNALEEVRREGTLHRETSDKITALSAKGMELGNQLSAVEKRMLEVEQKMTARPAAPAERPKSATDIIIESDQYKSSKAMSQHTMAPVNIGFAPHLKTVITNATLNNDQPLVQSQRLPGIVTAPDQRLVMRDLIPQAVTTSNLIEYASENVFTNNAGPQGGTSPIGHGEGEPKNESAITFTLSSVAVTTLAHWIPASRQVLSDAAALRGHIETRLMYGLKYYEDTQILTGSGAAGQLNGLVNQATAYNRGVTNDTALDTLLKSLLQVSLSNYEATAFVLNPIDWYAIMQLKDTTNRYLFSNPQDMVAPRLWAKPVVATASMTQGKFLAGAFNLACQIWDREDATVRISENVDDHFVRNLVAILVEERLALVVTRAAALVYGNTSHAG